MRQLAFATKRAAKERLNQVNTPTLVVMGTKDPDWPDPVAEAQFIADALAGDVVLVEGAGHYPQTEMPAQTIPPILEFLSRVSSTENGSREYIKHDDHNNSNNSGSLL